MRLLHLPPSLMPTLVRERRKNVALPVCLCISSNGQSELLSLLSEHGFEYRKRRPDIGQITNAVDVYDIIINAAVAAPTLATPLVIWLRGLTTRHIRVQTKRGTVVDVKGSFSDAKIDKIIESAERVDAFQTTKDADKTP